MQLFFDQYELNIGNIVLGTNFPKEVIDPPNIDKLMNIFVENGGMCIDTARSYNGGASEFIIGRWLKKSKVREKIIISTKAGHPEYGKKSRLAKNEIESDLHQSLKTLKTDYIDLLWLHRDNVDIPVEIIIDMMNSFIVSGKIRFFGASNWKFDRIKQANEYAEKTGQIGFSCSQIQWAAGVPVNSVYKDYGMICMDIDEYNKYRISRFPLFAYSSQAKGYFYYSEAGKEYGYRQQGFDTEKNREVFRKLKLIANKYDVPLTYPILSFIFSSPLNAIPIVGCRSVSDLLVCFSALDFILKSEEYKFLLSF